MRAAGGVSVVVACANNDGLARTRVVAKARVRI
jgi:hypothetical protein